MHEKLGFLFRREQIISIINRCVPGFHCWHRTNWRVSSLQHYIRRIHQVGVDVAHFDSMRFAANVLIFEDGLFLHIERTKADDDTMHRRHAARFVAPLEGAMSEVNMYALTQQPAPQHTYLLTLGN